MIKERNLDPTLRGVIKGDVIPGAAEKHYICKAAGVQNAYWQTRVPEFNFHTTITQAYNAMVTGQGDVAYLSADSHTQASALTWAKNMTNLVGMYGPARMNQRSRIGHSAAMAPLLTVSGYGNTFANLYFMYGTDDAANLNLLTVTGPRNSFIRCHFGGPFHATPGDEANFDLIRLGTNETYFKDCTFGTDTIAWTNGNMIEFQNSTDPPRTVFENCSFYMDADNAQVTFLKFVTGLPECIVEFIGCRFINIGSSLTLGIDGTGLGSAKVLFDRSGFIGVTDIAGASYESDIYFSTSALVAADEANGMFATYDHTA